VSHEVQCGMVYRPLMDEFTAACLTLARTSLCYTLTAFRSRSPCPKTTGIDLESNGQYSMSATSKPTGRLLVVVSETWLNLAAAYLPPAQSLHSAHGAPAAFSARLMYCSITPRRLEHQLDLACRMVPRSIIDQQALLNTQRNCKGRFDLCQL
jgi:hypothetical protein